MNKQTVSEENEILKTPSVCLFLWWEILELILSSAKLDFSMDTSV